MFKTAVLQFRGANGESGRLQVPCKPDVTDENVAAFKTGVTTNYTDISLQGVSLTATTKYDVEGAGDVNKRACFTLQDVETGKISKFMLPCGDKLVPEMDSEGNVIAHATVVQFANLLKNVTGKDYIALRSAYVVTR